MSEAIGPFLIISLTGAFFLAGIMAIDRIRHRGSLQSFEAGALEGDTRNFSFHSFEDEFRHEEF